jgi:hypothetical protein
VQLVKLGVLTKTETTQGNRTLWLYTVDTTWNRERYQWEFEERYRTETQTDSARSIKDEIGRLQQALSNASPTDMLKIIERIKELTLQMQNGESKPKEQAKTTPEPAPVEEEQSKEAPDDEEERFMDFLVAEHAPERPIAWRNWAKQAIKKGEFVGIDDYRREFDERQTIRAITEYLKKEVPRLEFGKSQQVFAGLVHYSSEKARYLANYGGHEVQVSPETVQKALTQMIETQQQR